MKVAINRWAEEDRPREKMIAHGASTLSTAELLAILIGSGNTKESAVELMRRIFDDYHQNLNELGKAEIDELCQYEGIGPAKAVSIAAAMELGRRRKDCPSPDRICISSSIDIYRYFHPIMCDLPVEACYVLLLNQANVVICHTRISIGGWTQTAVDVRVVLRDALIRHAVAIALCHNHPSGNIRPSREDDRITELLKNGAQAVGITLLDHIVLTDGKYYSYADEGRI